MPAIKKEEIPFASGVLSSKVPRLELIPYEGLVRTAARFELGIERKGEGKAWNATSKNQDCLTDLPFILARIGHVLHHASRLEAKLLGQIADDGDDDAGAIGWSGMFLCCATKALKEAKSQKNCSACGGLGTIQYSHGPSDPVHPTECPACKGTGRSKL